MSQRLETLQLLVVTGKGGVGKTVVTAALGRLMAARGRTVLLLEIDPRENLHQLLDARPSGGEIVDVGPRLYLQHLDPRRILDDIVEERLKIGVLVNRVLDSPVHKHFTEGAPGLKETAVFGRSLRLLRGHRPRHVRPIDMVILDAPASGHGVSLMAAPRLVADVIRSGPIGHMASEIANFLSDEAATGVVAVTTAEEMPVQETVELIEVLDQRVQRQPEFVVANALYPPLPENGLAEDPATDLWRRRRQINETELARLDEHWPGPIAEIPLLPIDPGPPLVGAVGRRLEPQLRDLP